MQLKESSQEEEFVATPPRTTRGQAMPPPLPLKSCLKARKSCMKRRSTMGHVPSCASPTSSPTSVMDHDHHCVRRRRSKRRVAFSRIQIHEHNRIMGDNPSCSEGAPLTIGWEVVKESTYELEYYEAYNPSYERRKKEHFKLNVTARSAM